MLGSDGPRPGQSQGNGMMAPWLVLAAASLLAFSSLAKAATPPFDDDRYLRFTAGANDIAIEPNAGAVAWPAEFTLEAWVYVTSPSPYGVIAGRVGANRGADPFYHAVLAFEGPDGLTPALVQTTGAAGSYRAARAASAIPVHTWVHLAGVREGATLRLYVNGVQAGTETSVGPTQASPGMPFAVGAGARADAGGAQCCGSNIAVRNVKLWRRALSAADVQASGAANAYATLPADLVRFWPLDDGRGSQLRSAVPGASALQASGSGTGPAWVEGAFLRPAYEVTQSNLAVRSSGIFALWPVRIGNQTHFLTTDLVWPPTVPGSETPISVLSPNGTNLVDSSSTRLVGNPTTVHPRDAANLDVNGDGREDIVLADHGTDTAPFPGGLARLLVQQADGRFADETAARLPGPARFHHNIAAGDFNGDGHDDIFFCSFSQFSTATASTVMVNDGTGHFAQGAAGQLPASIESGSLRCLAARPLDVEGDGDLDLAVALYRPAFFEQPQEPRDRILLNDGTGRFTLAPEDVLPTRPLGPASQTVAMAVADLDGDANPDLVISSTVDYRGKPALQYLRGRGDGTFEDRSHELYNDWPMNTWIYGILPRDFDGDGRMDLFLQVSSGLGAQPKTARTLEILLNRGRVWIPAGSRAGLDGLVDDGTRAVPVDVDGDGDLDIAYSRGDRRGGYALQVRPFANDLGQAAMPLRNNQATSVLLGPGQAHERLFFDVPAQATQARFEVAAAADVDLYVARVPFSTDPVVGKAPQRDLADARATTASGNELITLGAGTLSPGRWYVTPVNMTGAPVEASVRASITAANSPGPLAAGHFFNPSRSGHGVSYEYVAGQRVLIWYTFHADGTPIWYYAQDFAPSPDRGQWSADLLRFQWHSDRTTSRRVGSVTVTETGKNQEGGDTLVMSWSIDGEGGSEMMQRLGGVGCPPGYEGNNGMWFAPSLSGYGYTVTYFPNYEFIPVYLYDRWGNPLWVSGEKGNFSGADSVVPLFQLDGFCPTCERAAAPSYEPAGSLSRRFTGGVLTGLGLDVTLGGWTEGQWKQDRPVVLLTDPSNCTVP